MSNQDQKNERITVIVDTKLHDQLKAKSDEAGLSLSKYCAYVLQKKENKLTERDREIMKAESFNEMALIASQQYKKPDDYSSAEHAIAKFALESMFLARSLTEYIVKSTGERLEILEDAERQAKLSAHCLAMTL